MQLLFPSLAHLVTQAGRTMGIRKRPDTKLPVIDYTIRLSAALRAYNLTHPLHDVLAATAKLQTTQGHATIPTIMAALCCTYQNVAQHLLKSPDLFHIDNNASPRRITLSTEAITLLQKIKIRTSRPIS